jgi:hypothetical protein
MSGYAVRIDSFTSLDDLTKKQRRDPDAVLAALRNVKRISCWDMETGNLWVTVNDLEKRGLIVTDNTVGYPWIGVRVVGPVTP